MGPILRALLHHKVRFDLIALEIALTLAIVVNCVNLLLDLHRRVSQTTGLDEDRLIGITILPFSATDESLEANRDSDLRRLRELPGVDAAMAISSFPGSGSTSITDASPPGVETYTSLTVFEVGEGATETLGLEMKAGRTLSEDDFLLPFDRNQYDANVLVSQAAADAFFPDGDAVGKLLQHKPDDPAYTIVGVFERMTHTAIRDDVRDRTLLIPARPGTRQQYRYLVRTSAAAGAGVAGRLEEALTALEARRKIDCRSLTEIRWLTFRQQRRLSQVLVAVIVLLVLVTVLGIVSLTSFSVTERTRQIGTRRALGATRGEIVRYFLAENWIVTTMGLAVGVVFAFALNWALLTYANGIRLEWPLLGVGMAILWVSSLGAALAPAVRGARIPPVVATRSV